MKQEINLVWFKRDLRLRDHQPLQTAIDQGFPTLLCFFFEPSVMNCPESADRHWRFLYESIQDIQQQLFSYQLHCYVFHAEVVPTLEQINRQYNIRHILSHQETGLKITFDRDKYVKQFCIKHTIKWLEFGQDGVQRGIKNRIGWNKKVDSYLKSPILQNDLSQLQKLELDPAFYKKIKGIPLPYEITTPHKNFQQGGERMAWRYLESFMKDRYPTYFKHISKPAKSRKSCSRLSPYLAFGNLSCRQVWQYAEWKIKNTPYQKRHPLAQFQSRIWWRSHFIQKLETEWQMEFRAINKGLRQIPRGIDERLFNAWATGHTGFPMIDANMRCLHQTGYINFRMRAMLVSFLTFPLWQDWKKGATHLAKLFLDFEPGIHFSQFQMQAGLTGYNTLRLYNPTFQIEKHDPDGVFIKKWLPELKNVPTKHIAKPWEMTMMEQTFYNCIIGKDYPHPIVEFKQAAKTAKDLYWQHKTSTVTKTDLPRVLHLHCVPPNQKKKTKKTTKT